MVLFIVILYYIDPPSQWCPQPIDANGVVVVHFEPIAPSTAEYSRATKKFEDTCGSQKRDIVSVKRIQNLGEYARFVTFKSTLERTLGHGKVVEKEVFHGTKMASINPICSQGFNRNFAADANGMLYNLCITVSHA